MRTWVATFVVAALAGCATPPTGSLEGTVTMGPICPVERDPPDPDCAPRPFEGWLDLLEDGKPVLEFYVENGTFQFDYRVGTYALKDQAESYPSCHAGPFQIREGETTTVHVECDTGIR